MAMAQVLVLRKEPLIAPAEVAVRVDRYLAGFRARRKWLIRLALVGLAYWPLATLRPPFHMMSVDLRERWIRRRFIDDVADRVIPGWLRTARQTTILAAQQFCYMGYYGDEAAAEKAGYIPFSRRPGYAEAMKQRRPGAAGRAVHGARRHPGRGADRRRRHRRDRRGRRDARLRAGPSGAARC